MKVILSIIFFAIIAFDVFMATPFGAFWVMKDLDECRPVRGILIAFFGTLIAMPIGCFLGYIE